MNTYQFLSTIDPFSKLAPDQLALVASSYEKKRLPEGTVLIKQGQPVSQVGIIQSGLAKVTVVDHIGDELTCGYLQSGDLIFDVAILSGTVTTASVISLEPILCFLQTQQTFLETIDAHPHMKNFFYHKAALGIRWGFELFCGRYMSAVDSDCSSSYAPPFVRKALAYIDRNYQKPITLEMVAKETAMSKFHFSRLFKQHAGISFKRYLNRKRIEVAKVLITRDSLNVTEACYAVGFNDASYFSRVFREVEGRSPSRLLIHGSKA